MSVDPKTISNEDERRAHDIDFLLNTMREYSAQLSAATERRGAQIQIFAGGISIFSALAAFVPFLLQTEFFDTLWRTSALWRVAVSASFLFVLAGLATALVVSVRQSIALRYESLRLKRILDTLVRRASQFLDRGEITFAQRVMLDVILTDAEFLVRKEPKMYERRDSEGKQSSMTNVYVEARPKGRAEGSHIDDYVVEDHADHVLSTFKTQREAIDWAKSKGQSPLVARVRHLNDKKRHDHWRAA